MSHQAQLSTVTFQLTVWNLMRNLRHEGCPVTFDEVSYRLARLRVGPAERDQWAWAQRVCRESGDG